MSDHNPVRGPWRCTGCGQVWPCRTRRFQLITEYESWPHDLYVGLVQRMILAMRDLPETTCGEMLARFLDWLPPRQVPFDPVPSDVVPLELGRTFLPPLLPRHPGNGLRFPSAVGRATPRPGVSG